MWILIRSDTNQAVPLLEVARGLKFCILGKYRYFTIQVAKTKALISFAVTTYLHMETVGFLMPRLIYEGAFGKYVARSFFSVTDEQTHTC